MPKYTPDIDKLFEETPKAIDIDSVDDELEMAVVQIDMEEINEDSERVATLITEKLSGYYFSQEYIDEHPYIPTKIMLVMNNIRRLLKMLSVNERAQDSLIIGVSYNAGKGSLYTSLTALQNSMLNIQTQLNNLVKELEEIFAKMQEECEKTFKEKDHEQQSDGSVTVRGAKEFIQQIQEMQRTGKLPTTITPLVAKKKEEQTAEELDKNMSMDDLIKK